jgi:hypothetical protein
MASIFKSTWNNLYFLTASPYGKLKDFFTNLDDLKEDYLCYRLPYCVKAIERYKKSSIMYCWAYIGISHREYYITI